METTNTNTPAATTAAKVPATAGTRKPLLMVQTESYVNALVASLGEMNIDFSNYQKICVINCIQKMKEMLNKEGLDFKTANQDNISQILQQVSMLQLNIAASPRECYLQFRNTKINGEWVKLFEFGIEGDGNDKILRTYGVDVKGLKGPFVVRDGDDFTYPSFDGEKIVAPTWTPKSYYKMPIKVFYIVEKADGTKEYLIAEREEVVKNLQAHITNNMMKEPEEKKNAVIEKMFNMTIDDILADKELRNWISPAWYNPQSRNDMIVRKMKNNATKKYPKDFKNAFVEGAYENTFDDYDQYREPAVRVNPIDAVEAEVNESAGTTPVSAPMLEETSKTPQQTVINAYEPKNEVKQSVEKPQQSAPAPKAPVEEDLPY